MGPPLLVVGRMAWPSAEPFARPFQGLEVSRLGVGGLGFRVKGSWMNI